MNNIHQILKTDTARITLAGHTLELIIMTASGGYVRRQAQLPYQDKFITSERVSLYLTRIFQEPFHDAVLEPEALQFCTSLETEEEELCISASLAYRLLLAWEQLGLVSRMKQDSAEFLVLDSYYSIYTPRTPQ